MTKRILFLSLCFFMCALVGCGQKQAVNEDEYTLEDIELLSQQFLDEETLGEEIPLEPIEEIEEEIPPPPLVVKEEEKGVDLTAPQTIDKGVTLNVNAVEYEMTSFNIQKALANAGFYDGKIDGKIGPMSREAIKKFQKAKGLKVDAVVGRQTWEALQKYLPSAENGSNE